TVKGTATVTASASDNVGVVGVQFLLDDGVNGSADVTTAPYSISWNTATASDGSHKITAIARDAAGNRSPVSAPVTVTVANNTAPPPASTRFEDTDPSVVYSGPGWRADKYAALSNGGATATDQAGAQATFTFTGTSVSWIGGRWTEEGIARVFLDGSFVAEVDTYSPTKEVQVPLFTALDLANTSHTLTIEVTGRQNPAAATAIVVVDAFDVITSGRRREETDPAITYTAGWLQGNRDHPYSEGTAAVSTIPGDRATFTFTGTSVSWIGYLGPQAGIARVILDGTVVADSLDMFVPSPSESPQKAVFTIPGLAAVSHTLTIEVTGSKNPASLGVSIVIDAFDGTP
ncbi:MAG TPA: Ig-like domain-containing protein, partial [Vicinamibacterales bacterium]